MEEYNETCRWNTAITMLVQPSMANCPTKYIDKLALLLDLQPFILELPQNRFMQELPENGLTLFRDHSVVLFGKILDRFV